MKYKLLLTLALVSLAGSLHAQTRARYKYTASLQRIDSAAFYLINLPPGVLAKSTSRLADIKIYGKTGVSVPYVFGDQLPVTPGRRFIVFPEKKPANETDSATTFIAENSKLLTINQLNLRLKNTAVVRYVDFSGSDDMQKWYAIKEWVGLQTAGDSASKTGIFEQQLNFPASNYRYFKVQVNNGRKYAVNIIDAGVYESQTISPQYTQLPNTRFSQQDTGKLTRVVIKLNDAYPVNKIHLDFGGAKYYKRNISIFTLSGKYRTLVGDTVISSGAPADVYLVAKSKFIAIEINNEDNPPLQIKNVTAWQLSQSVIAYLEKGQSYQLMVGDSAAAPSNYDLKFFTDSLKHQLPLATVGLISANPDYKVAEPKPLQKSFPTWALWAVIIAVLTALGALTFTMTKEVGKRGN